MEIYRISKLTVWCGDDFENSYRYKEMAFTTEKKLIDKLSKIKVKKTFVWPVSRMAGWPMYRFERIYLITNYDSYSDFVIYPSEPM